MKKIYQNPQIAIVMVRTNHLMEQVSGFNETVNPTGTNGNNALGRRGWLDDDDDDE